MSVVPVLLNPQTKVKNGWAHAHTVYTHSPPAPHSWWTLPATFLLTHAKEAFNPFHELFYLIVASKTWTVESLSNETVLITNLTAFWNSDEFPIIFKKRNTNHYDTLK